MKTIHSILIATALLIVIAQPSYSQTVVYLTANAGKGNQVWTVPSDWNSPNNTIEVIGAGGDGGTPGTAGGCGGGGGAYAKITNLSLTPGGFVTYAIGVHTTTTSTAGNETYFNGTTSSTASVLAASGKLGTSATVGAACTGALGGSAADSNGTTKNAGGKGGDAIANAGGSAGGGGAGGPGGGGAAAGNYVGGGGGGGGGGNGGGSAGSNNSGTTGGNGGASVNSTPGGTGGTVNVAGNPGSYGSGGGGGGGNTGGGGTGKEGGKGGNGTDISTTHGSGGGGGGGGRPDGGFTGKNGGAGGAYGGGGGGGSYNGATPGTGGAGGDGIIIITYTPVLPVPWYDKAWIYRTNITFNSTRVAQNGLTDFPVLINISHSNLSTFARADGNDILFTASDGSSKLDHEIENYTSNGNLVAWVRIPSLSNTTNTSIFMYYGNPSATNQQNRTGVWNSSYMGVWHLHEGAGTRANDSTRYNNNGTISGGERWNATGSANTIIDGALDFDGSNNNVNVPDDNTLDFATSGSLAISAWIRQDSLAIKQAIADKSNGASVGWRFITDDTDSTRLKFISGSQFAEGVASNANVLTAGVWQHVAVSLNSTATFYVNGTSQGGGGPSSNSMSTTVALVIGAKSFAASSVVNFNGMMTEVRIHNGTLSSGWIRTEYNNQFEPFTFHILGETNAVPNTCVPPSNTNWTIEASDNCTVSGRSINVTNVFIQGSSGRVIFRHSNVTATDCRIQPSVGALIMLAIEPTVNWGNAC